MTTDERIARLTERHEALTQSVESLLATSREQSKQVEGLIANSREHSKQIVEHTKQLDEIMEAAARLLHLAEIHEARISRLENQRRDEFTQ